MAKRKIKSQLDFELKSPLSAQLEITQACNNKCSHCYNYWRYLKDKKEIKIEKELKLDHFLKVAKKMADADIFYIVITGGEPLLRKDIVYSLIDYLNSRNIDTSLNTNLTLITKKDINILRKKGLKSILTSFYTYKESVFNKISKNNKAYEQTIRGISKIREAGMGLNVNMVVTKKNKNDVYKTGEFLYKKFGSIFFCATPVNPCTNADYHKQLMLNKQEIVSTLESLIALENDFGIKTDILEPIPHCLIFHKEKLSKFLKRMCAAGTTTIAVDPFGNVRACTHNLKNYGNLLKENLGKIWDKMHEWRIGKFIPEECNGCSVEYRCKGACRTESEAIYGSLNSPNLSMTKKLKLREEPTPFSLEKYINKKLRVDSNIRYRKEGKGYILYSPPYNFMYVIPDHLELLGILSNESTFTVDTFFNRKINKDQITSFFKRMIIQEMVKEVK